MKCEDACVATVRRVIKIMSNSSLDRLRFAMEGEDLGVNDDLKFFDERVRARFKKFRKERKS